MMGGENTEITADSTTILIEAAYFEPTNIRKTATKLGLRSDALFVLKKALIWKQWCLPLTELFN